MRSSILSVLMLGSLWAGGSLLSAQVYRDDPYYRDGRDAYGQPGGYRDNRDYRDYRDRGRADTVNRVIEDLRRARSYDYVDHHERKHFEHAERELVKFQDRYYSGRFDRHHLDEAINDLHHLVNARQVNPRDRDLLARDLDMLRDFRARGSYGYYDRRY